MARMRLNPQAIAIQGSDDDIRSALSEALPPPLLCSVAHLTGDMALLRDDLRHDPMRMLEPNSGFSDDQLALARKIAGDALIEFRDRGSVAAPAPDAATLHTLLEFITGGSVAENVIPLIEEELALDGSDLRAPKWNKHDIAPDQSFTVAIIGAGMSGIAAAHRLQQAGVPFVIFEKNATAGGTWLENDYPGCRVDIPNHFYSYSFAQTVDWPQFYSPQRVLLEYFNTCVDEFGLRQHIQFNTEVLDSTFDDDQQRWAVRVRGADGREVVHDVEAIVSAVGQLNRPKMPNIDGLETFAGPSFHSARWDHSVDLTGQRVAVIGTGASAAQFIPSVADAAEHLTVFQRTPPWLLPVENYQDDIPPTTRWLLEHVPSYARWDRAWIMARTNTGLLPLATVDPAWEPKDRSVSAMNDFLREMLTMAYQMLVPDETIYNKLLPQYPPIAKRVVLDNGLLPLTLQRPDVTLTTESIDSIYEGGVRTADGTKHNFDVIIYGTGFEASKFLMPMRVTGVDGADLHERWGGDARAYLGITVPEFPNLFMMYGPNTNIVINGSIIYFSECETNFIVESIRMLLTSGKRSMDTRPEVHDEYNERIDAGNKMMAWGVSDVNSWYKNEHGRVAQNWPFSLHEYWLQTREPNPNDFILR